MEEHNEEQRTPPRFPRKWKIASMTLLVLVIFFSVGYVGLEGSSSSEFCSSCHEMKPEFYTWKNSTHSEVDCVDCHTEPGLENVAKSKGETIEQAIKKQMQTYEAPIRMPSEIPDESCEKCHNINTRSFTPSGDLIIPHDKHKTKGISCMQCHRGVAHGKIADRQITFQADYSKWDDQLGTAIMSERKFVAPDMETCMECHRLRNAPLECSACHTTGMLPDTHLEKTFKPGGHGKLAADDLKDCSLCHDFMSKEEIEGYEEVSALSKFLKQESNKPIKSHYNYAKDNTFCRDCHSIRPKSHSSYFMMEHGVLAQEDQQRCLTCHEYNNNGSSQLTTPTCNSCHPASHKNNYWRIRHPVPLSPGQKLVESCYTCHNESKCASCHQQNPKKEEDLEEGSYGNTTE